MRLEGGDQVAGLELSLLTRIDHDAAGTRDDDIIQLALAGKVGSRRVDVSTGRQPRSLQDWLARTGDRNNNVSVTNRRLSRIHGLDC